MADSTEFMTLGERVEHAVATLPTLGKEEIPLDDACPICFQNFEAIFEGKTQEDTTFDNALLIASDPEELRGVTKLRGCGHVFCRKDLIEWIRGWHGTCPACRAQFANIRPPSDSEDGSSDGDYVPNDDEEDDDLDEDDGFVESDGWDTGGEDEDFGFDVEGDVAVGYLPGYPDIDLAADIDAFIAEHGDGRDSPRFERGPIADLAADFDAFIEAHQHGRNMRGREEGQGQVDGYRRVRPGDRGLGWGAEAIGYSEDGNRAGSEAEVSQDLNAGGDADMDEGMENWGLSHSDGDASESLSEGELFASIEDDPHMEDDAAVVAEPGSPSAEVPEAETK